MSLRPRRAGLAAASASLAAALAGCASAGPATQPDAGTPPAGGGGLAPAREACLLAAPAEPLADTVRVALLDSVSPAHAPAPTNRSERLVFAQLYEPLLRRDCTGALRPALAAEWSAEDSGRTWVLRLREGARWTDDGVPVTAADVVASLRGRGIVASALGDRGVAVTPSASLPRGPALLADLALAIARPGRGEWPSGTGPYRLDSTATTAAGPGPPLRWLPRPGGDARDLLDGGADLVVTDDPVALAYARERSALLTIPLPWDRAYALVSSDRGRVAAFTAAERDALAHDAVRVEARAASECTTSAPAPAAEGAVASPAAAAAPSRIVYPRGDRVARDLAARLVASGRAGPAGTAVALDSVDIAAALRAGRDAAVLPISSRDLAECRAPGPPGAVVVPLIQVRPAAVLRRGATPPALDGDGALRWTGREVAP
ncbi:MAG TPA: ABC transporter substrate-binding protein [Gemmatimonadales bacterium]|nr:ABC transporter substrate-binding protein [Gemmatimonadales bacterium]